MGLQVDRQVPLKVYYGQRVAGEYFADLVVENKVIRIRDIRVLLTDLMEK